MPSAGSSVAVQGVYGCHLYRLITEANPVEAPVSKNGPSLDSLPANPPASSLFPPKPGTLDKYTSIVWPCLLHNQPTDNVSFRDPTDSEYIG